MSSEDAADERDDGPERYVHDPSEFGTDAETASATRTTPGGAEGMGRRGWLLLATVVGAFFLAPAVIYLRPPGVPTEVAFLVVPLVPAFLLGATAVWAMAGRGRRG